MIKIAKLNGSTESIYLFSDSIYSTEPLGNGIDDYHGV